MGSWNIIARLYTCSDDAVDGVRRAGGRNAHDERENGDEHDGHVAQKEQTVPNVAFVPVAFGARQEVDDRREQDAHHRQTGRADQRDQVFQVRHQYGQTD